MTGFVEVRNAVGVVVATAIILKIFHSLWKGVWRPMRMRQVMVKQGLDGPPFRAVVGHLLETTKFRESFPESMPLGSYGNFSPTVMPQYALFGPHYGKNFVYQFAADTRLVLRDPDMAKEVFVNNHKFLRKLPLEDIIVEQVIGFGLISLVGEKWVTERRTLNPFFHTDALKARAETMVEATLSAIQRWEKLVADGGGEADFDVQPDVHKISGRIISVTAFGGDCEKGEQIYQLQRLIADEVFKSFRNPLARIIPNYRKIPTQGHKFKDECSDKVDALLHGAINGRKEAVLSGKASSYGDDLLGRMLSAAVEGWETDTEIFNYASVFNNCKLFYFAGQDTAANAIMFAMMLLANHPEWQDRARQELDEVLGDGQEITFKALSQLKVMGMIVNETLRLFTPVPAVARVATEDLHLKGLFVPKGLELELAIQAIHQDKDFWGDDVGDFNPERFSNGVTGACSPPHAFMPFGLGPKYCIGNNFAIMEAKLVLAMVLQRFKLSVSPSYRHHPTLAIVQRPKFGMHLILKAL